MTLKCGCSQGQKAKQVWMKGTSNKNFAPLAGNLPLGPKLSSRKALFSEAKQTPSSQTGKVQRQYALPY